MVVWMVSPGLNSGFRIQKPLAIVPSALRVIVPLKPAKRLGVDKEAMIVWSSSNAATVCDENKMSKRSLTFCTILLALILFASGWLLYSALLDATASGANLAFVSLDELVELKLWTALSFALLGVSAGIGALLSGNSSTHPRYAIYFAMLLLAGLIAALAWALLLANRMAAIVPQLSTGLPLPPGTRFSLLANTIPLYQIGLFGSGCVLTIAVVLTYARERKLIS